MSLSPKDIGLRIKAARVARHWSQLDLAAEAHVSPSSVSRWERGLLPTVRELIRLADVLGVEPEYLVEPPEEPEIDAAVLERLDRIEQLVLLVLARSAPDDLADQA